MTKQHKKHDDVSSQPMQRNVLHICSMIQICETVIKKTQFQIQSLHFLIVFTYTFLILYSLSPDSIITI